MPSPTGQDAGTGTAKPEELDSKVVRAVTAH